MAERNPLSSTELSTLEAGRPIVRAAVEALDGAARAGAEWELDRKTLSGYLSGKRRPNRRSADKLLSIIQELKAGKGKSEGEYVSRGTHGQSVRESTAGTLSSAPPDPPVSLPDPVVELVRRGQAEQAAWVLEFAAKLLEAGAQRLRQGIADFAVQQEIEGAGEAITRSATGRTGQSPPIQSTG